MPASCPSAVSDAKKTSFAFPRWSPTARATACAKPVREEEDPDPTSPEHPQG